MKLYNYQVDGVQWMIQRENDTTEFLGQQPSLGGILADEVGLGKTIMTIQLCIQHKVPKTLLIVPKSLINQWKTEISKHSNFSLCICSDNDKVNTADITLVSQSRFNSRGIKDPLKTPYSHIKWDRIVIDEAHCIKNKNSKLHKAICFLKSRYRWGLTATPVMNKMTDFVYILNYIGVSQSLCQNYKDDVSVKYILRRTKNDVKDFNQTLDLPKLNVNICKIPFQTSHEQNLYKNVFLEIKNTLSSMKQNNNTNTIQALELLLRIRQICCHPQCYLNGIGKKSDLPPDIWQHNFSKTDKVLSMIQNQPPNDKALIFCHFKQEMTTYASLLKQYKYDCIILDGSLNLEEREHAVYEFNNNPNKKIFIIQIQTGGVGLNLQAANWVYITSPHWSPAYQHQIIGRAHRTGQTKDVNVFIMTMSGESKNTYIEEWILQLQQEKRKTMSNVLKDTRIEKEGELLLSDIKSGITFSDVYRMFNKI